MIKKKICMLGSFAVGKTSLVRQYVDSIFSEKYHTSIGVKIDKKVVTVEGKAVNLILWDIHGEDEFQKIQASHLIGTSGYFLVIDGTRSNTVAVVKELNQFTIKHIGAVPFMVLINKADLLDDWEIIEEEMELLKEKGWEIVKTSAKTGEGVEEAFKRLAVKILEYK